MGKKSQERMTGKTEEERSQRFLDHIKKEMELAKKALREANAFVFR